MLILCRVLGGKVLDRYGRERILPPSLTICIISMVVLGFSKTIPMFVLVAVVWGIGYAFMMPLLLAYTVDRAGSSLGPAMGTFTAVSDLGLSLGPPIMGTIIHFTSYSIMFLCLAFMGFLSLNYFLFFVKKKDEPLMMPEHMLQYVSKRQQKPEAARNELTKKEDENDH